MKNPYLALLRTAWQYARHERRRYVFVYALFVAANVVGALHPLLFGWFISAVQQQPTHALTITGQYAGAFLGLKLLEWCCHGPARVMERELAFSVSRNFLNELYRQTLHRPVAWHKTHHSGATINRIRKAYEALKNFFQSGFMYLHALSKFVFSFGAMLYFSPLFGGIGVLLGALTVWVIFRFDKPFVRTLEATNEREHAVSSTLFDSLANILTVITLRLEKRMEAGLHERIGAVLPPFRQNVRINEWKWFVASMLIALIYAVVTVGYTYQHYVPGEVFLVGGLVTLLGYVNQFTSVFVDVAFQYTQIVQYNTDVQTAARSLRSEADAQLPPTPPLPHNWQQIAISRLNFMHQPPLTNVVENGVNRPTAQLHEVAIRLARGQRVALIGESGSGKSTLLTLLRGLYPAQPNVVVTVDGQPHADLRVLADSVTLLPQEPEIFENTLGYNITLGLPFSNEDVMQACETAHFADIVRHLPAGLDTDVQEKGVNLSGGQRQRLALARGLLAARHSDVVLLDEPTSSVDPKTEFLIYHNLLRAFADKAVVSSLHRLHLLPLFDYVYILRDGRVVDEGSFTELRQRSGVFAEMWAHQKVISTEPETTSAT